jgi:amino acid adenylation domain-containing protein
MSALSEKLRSLTPEQRALFELRLRERTAAQSRLIPRAARRGDGLLPVSFAQQRLWFLHQLQPGSALYNTFLTIRLTGPLDTPALESALTEIVRRNDVLRTTFTQVNGIPVQRIEDSTDLPLRRLDLEALDPADYDASARDAVREEIRRPFDLEQGPVIRALLVELSLDHHILALTMHHIVSDRWSIDVLTRDLAAIYSAFSNNSVPALEPLPIQYADFAVWQRSPERAALLNQQLEWWKENLRPPLPVADLPFDHPRPAIYCADSGRIVTPVSSQVLDALMQIGRGDGTTLFMTMLAAAGVLLFRHTSQDEIIVGTPIVNRGAPETAPLIGCFVNTLVLRVKGEGDPVFREYLRRVRSLCLDAYEHQDLPFERLVEEVQTERTLSEMPLFQVMFALNDVHEPLHGGQALASALVANGLILSPYEVENNTVASDLVIRIERRASNTECVFEYRTDLFEYSTMAGMARRFETLLAAIAAQPGHRLSDLPALTPIERRQVLTEWSQTAPASSNGNITAMVRQQARTDPAAPSVSSSLLTLTRGELDMRARSLASLLRQRGVGPEARIAVCMNRTPEMVVAVLGVLYAGAAYLPLDPSYPTERLLWILEDSCAELVITSSELASRLGITKETVLMDGDPSLASEAPIAEPVLADPENLAYIIYTSGSTGRPKGVAVRYRGLSNLVGWHIARYQVGAQDRLSQVAALGFDASVWEIWSALASGAELFLAQEEDRLSPESVWAWLRNRRITIAFLPTPLAEAVLALPQRASSSLRLMLTGGDRLRTYPSATLEFSLVNHYGPTEYSVVATASDSLRQTPADQSAPPIGRPITNTEVFVLDENLAPAPPGVRGELCIGGDGLARGYLGRTDLTAERFIPHPFSSVPGAQLYRTGDWVRYRAGGVLEFLGRRDGLVKIRGFRVELSEIESVLALHPGVHEAAVVIREGAHGSGLLVAYVVAKPGAAPSGKELREWAQQRLPSYMVPPVCALREKLPLSANGKVDRHALAALPQEVSENSIDPRTPDEQALAEIWMELLGCASPGVHDDFFASGGHSLLATQLVSRIRSCFGIEVPLRQAFDYPTIAMMSGCIQEARRASSGIARPALVASSSAVPPQLSFAQRRLWFIAQLEPHSPAYNIPFAIRMRGDLNVDALHRALSEIVRRHETLRSRFLNRDGLPVLAIATPAPLALGFYDLSAEPMDQHDDAARLWYQQEALRPFDFAQEPPFRATLVRLDARDHILALTLHHITADGWSVSVLAREFVALYGAFRNGEPSPLQELTIRFRDYAAWQNDWLGSRVMDDLLKHWREKLDGAEVLEIPCDLPRPPVPSYRAGTVPFAIQHALWGNLQRIAREEGATSFMLLFAGWALLLNRYSGQSDIVAGTDIAGRDQIETEELIGLFINQLALRVTIDSIDTWRTLLQKARAVLIEAYAHQNLPFEVLVEALSPGRDLSRHPLFQCKLAIEDAVPALDLPDLESSLFAAGHPTIKTDLRMVARLTARGVEGRIEFALDLFEPATIERMAARMATLLAGAASEPDAPLAELPLISEQERQSILSLGRGPKVEFPCVGVHELFELQAEKTPDGPAISCEGRNWSYSEFNARANALAASLLKLGAGPEVRVGVCLERNERAILALLGVLKAGAAYVPMDPVFPPERLALLTKSARVSILVTLRRYCPAFAASNVRVLCLDDDSEIPALEHAPVRARVSSENLAYVIFTSGSTGTPKAVGIEHRNLVNYVLAVSARLQLKQGTRFALLSSLAADLGNTTLFASLCNGGVLHVIPEDLASDPDRLAAYFHEHSIECVKIAPSHLGALLLARAPERVLPSALLVLGGEASSFRWIGQLRALRPESRILNHYGPTETTVGVLAVEITSLASTGAPNIPLGTPFANLHAYVLDAVGNLVPEGIPGELYLGGAGVTRGYLGAPAQTAERFLPDRFSGVTGARLYRTGDRARLIGAGVIEFLGRVDRQIKVRGYRVEPGEIEAALNQHPDVAQSAVAVIDDKERGARIAAWFAPAPGRAPSTRDLREFLEQQLPAYMLPGAFVSVPALPLLANGKLDRRALPEPHFGVEMDEVLEPLRTPTEQLLARIWENVLGISRIGLTHNFFELGGHSLLATRVAARVREVFGIPLAVRAVFECRTLADMARRIDADRAAANGITPPPLVPASREAELPLSFSEQRLWFLQRFAPGDRSYLVPIVLRISGDLSPALLEAAFTEIVGRHEILRTSFPTRDDVPVRLIRPPGACPLPLADLRALPASEAEAELRRLIGEELNQPFDLATGPLLRIRLYQVGAGEHVLLVLLHHIVSDAWSSGVLLKEITGFYQGAGKISLPPLTVQYADFAFWQRSWLRGDIRSQLLEWWRARLDGIQTLELPLDRRRPATRSAGGGSCSISFDHELTHVIKSCASATGNTDFIVLLAGFAATLARFSGQKDIAVGTSVSGRIHPAVEPLLGCFVNTLVLRCMLDGDPAFSEILSRVRETTLAAWDHQELPFESLVEDLHPVRAMQSTPLFQVMFVLQNAPRPEIATGNLRFHQAAFETGMAKFDLTLILHELREPAGTASYVARLEYRTDIFDRNTIEQMLRSFRCLLASAVHAPERPFSSLALLEADLQDKLLAEVPVASPRSLERTVHGMFAERVQQTPNAIALEFGDGSMNYSDLDSRANQLAHHLRSLGAGPEVLVAVCLERSAELIVTLLAILKTGAAYLPLDPSEPAPRLAFVLADTGASLAITASEFAARIETAGATTLVLVDHDAGIISQQPETAPELHSSADNLAYVLYTSGSTGLPKGVAVPHRAILRLVDGNDFASIAPGHTFLQLAPVGFDASTFEIWGPLLNGASLAVFPPGVPSLGEIGAVLVRNRISTLWLTAGLFRLMVDEQMDSLRGVRQLLAGGDVLPVAQVRRVIEELPDCRLVNGYGPTENTTFTCCHTVLASDLEAPSIPIGTPIKYTEVFILDENMQLMPPGARGELYTGGEGLARGYCGRPDLTATAFVPHPFSSVPGARLYKTGDTVRRRTDGSIEFIGRKDGQVKIRGFRVEIGEIEAMLAQHPEVRESAVVVRDDAYGNRMIVAFIAPETSADGKKAVLDWMRQRLPTYMAPAMLVSMQQLPLTANGKIDRNTLAAAPLEASEPVEEYVAPRTPEESTLADIWKDLLGLQRVSIHSNFFELGGHSLLATQLGSRIERQFGVIIPLQLIFENATIADLAETVEVLRWMVDQNRGTGAE